MKTNPHRILSLLSLLCLPPSTTVVAQQTLTGYQSVELTYNGTKYIRQQTYYDGLGRPIKKFTTMNSSAAKPDRIQLIAYDIMGRDDSVTYLPYAGMGTRNMQQCFIDQKNFYDNSAYGDDGKYAYSLKTYDKSPQNIVTSVSAPGEYHNVHSQKGHPILLTNRLNLQSDRIKQYVIQNDSMIYFKGWYQPDCLTVEEQRTDLSPGNSVCTRTYKNSRGQIIATSVQAGDEECRTTYFIYDDNYDDRLRCVIPPVVDRQIRPQEDPFAWYRFRDQIRFMEYDDRGNMIREYYPGREHTCYIYDRLHRIVLSQDGNQRPKEYWTCYRYDDLGRIFQIAQVHSYNSEQTLRSSCINTSGKYTENQLDALTRAPTLLAEYRYGGYSDYKIVVENNVQKKQHTTFRMPTYLTAVHVANVFYTYDIGDNTGLKIYEKIAALTENSGSVERAFYYDSDGRMIQSVEKNAAGGITRISNKYDFTGNLLTCHESVQASSDAKPDIKVTTYTYDDLGQLLTEKVQLNDSPEAAIACSYDQLGHCVKTVAGDELLNTTLKYDISGYLTAQVNEVFQMQLYRDRPFSPLVSPNYAGMISECRWNHRKGVSENWHSYQYAYTPYGEFQGVQLQHGPAMQPRNVEKNLTYDWNGNILTLQRTGTDGSLIADYSCHYSGNRLDSLSDAGDSVRTFSYDANGNMISDSKINCKFQYNILNLTEKVSDAGLQELVRYTWLFDGSKMRARTSDGNGYTYLGSLIYADTPAGTALESTGFSNGRIVRTSSGYAVQYHVRDHLGSVRSIVDEEGEVVEVDDYYPFGQRWDKPAAPRTDNRYLFNGKESQTFADLPLLDYGARMYDSDLGRWQVHDPKAADYYPTSPYAFCAGNPINLVDPNGMDYYKSVAGAVIWKDLDKEKITINNEVFKNIGKSYSIQLDEESFANFYQNVFISVSSQAVDAGQTVLNNAALTGALLSQNSPLTPNAQQGLMNDVVRQAQSDFINHPVTQSAIGLMSFVASGGVDAIMAIGRTAGNFIAKQTAMNAIESGQYNLTKTVAGHLAERPYIGSPSTITNVMRVGGKGVLDTSFKGGINYLAPGTFNGASGVYELGINPQTRTIYHFLFRQ